MTVDLVRRLGLAAALALGVSGVLAQPAWPSRALRLVVPFPPAGTSDTAARLVGEPLTKALGQPVVVDNRAGANGNIGMAEAARATADGHTFVVAVSGTLAVNRYLYPKTTFDVDKDFVPVSLMLRSPLVVVVPSSLGVRSLPQLLAMAKAGPKSVSYGSPALASTSHLAAELLAMRAGVDLVHVPYKGSAPMLQDLMAGQFQMAVDTLASSMPHIQSGKLLALAVTSAKPVPALPGVPTVASVLPGFEAEGWIAMMAPANTPPHVVERMSGQMDAILRGPSLSERWRQLGVEPVGGGPDVLKAFIASESRKWKEVVTRRGSSLSSLWRIGARGRS